MQVVRGQIIRAIRRTACGLKQHIVEIVRIEGKEFVRIGGKAEEIALLLDPLDRRAVGSEALAFLVEPGLALGVIGLVAHRIPTGIFVEIDVAILLHTPPDFFRRSVMTRLRGVDEIVV